MNNGFEWKQDVSFQWHDLFMNGNRVAYLWLAFPAENRWQVFFKPFMQGEFFTPPFIDVRTGQTPLDAARVYVEERVLIRELLQGDL